jgi:hypothetical protein
MKRNVTPVCQCRRRLRVEMQAERRLPGLAACAIRSAPSTRAGSTPAIRSSRWRAPTSRAGCASQAVVPQPMKIGFSPCGQTPASVSSGVDHHPACCAVFPGCSVRRVAMILLWRLTSRLAGHEDFIHAGSRRRVADGVSLPGAQGIGGKVEGVSEELVCRQAAVGKKIAPGGGDHRRCTTDIGLMAGKLRMIRHRGGMDQARFVQVHSSPFGESESTGMKRMCACCTAAIARPAA